MVECTKDEKYFIMMTGIIRPFVAECVDEESRVKVLNKGPFKDMILAKGEYILLEKYNLLKHGTY